MLNLFGSLTIFALGLSVFLGFLLVGVALGN